MTTATIAHPPIVSQDQWLAERKKLLAEEKELTKHYDRVSAARRRLPMVKVEKAYEFDGPTGRKTLHDLFEGRRQLLIYHFMFDPAWEKGCSGCTGFVNALGDLSLVNRNDTTFALISRALLEKLEKYKHEKGWDIPWFSSFGSDFNYDFNVSHRHPIPNNPEGGEAHGMSVFFELDGETFHTYSTYARGTESVTDSYRMLDLTPYGRQQAFEDSPEGWPQHPTYS